MVASPAFTDRGPRWAAVFARLLVTEGGFADVADDHGGATKYGLSLRFLAQTDKLPRDLIAELEIDHDYAGVDLIDIEDMTVATAEDTYFECFWLPYAVDLPQPIDAALFDQAVNDGESPAVRMLQDAVNICLGHEALTIDGLCGPATLTAVKGLDARCLLNAYRGRVVRRYQAIVAGSPSQAKFLKGWLNRAAELGDV